MRRLRKKQALKHPQDPAPFSTSSEGPRIAIYHRVSTLDQDKSLARRELESWATRQQGQISMLVEESASGAWNARPGLQRVLDAAKRGALDIVIVWKLDRWGRSSLDVLANIQALTDAGVRFVAVSQGLDVKPQGDAMSKLMLTVLAAVAEFERDLIKERTHLGLARARQRGIKLGRPRKQGPASHEVRALREQGKSWASISEALGCTVSVARTRAAE